jgi:predicted Zn-dependent protease
LWCKQLPGEKAVVCAVRRSVTEHDEQYNCSVREAQVPEAAGKARSPVFAGDGAVHAAKHSSRVAGTRKLLEAVYEYQKAVEMSGGNPDAAAGLAHVYAVIGRKPQAERILHDLEKTSKNTYVSAYTFATIYASLGDKDKAFQLLEKAYREKSLDISWHLKSDLRIDNLRTDPRFQNLMRRVGFAQ